MPLNIVRDDITNMKVDAIVNAANEQLLAGGGVCGAIFTKAGENCLQEECNNLSPCKVGNSVITKGYNLPAKYIIHAVGPIWNGGKNNEKQLLESAYSTALELAKKNNLESIAFPLISSGIYGYPKNEAINIAISTIEDFLKENEMEVYIVVFDKKAYEISGQLFEDIQEYINDNYVDDLETKFSRNRNLQSERKQKFAEKQGVFSSKKAEPLERTIFYSEANASIDDFLKKMDKTFSQLLLDTIDRKGKSDVEVYKKANIDRKLFSKIRSNIDYKPKKQTVIALAIGLELNVDETLDLLKSAGYTLSNSSKFDLIIRYFIDKGEYNINQINMVLFDYEQILLGA